MKKNLTTLLLALCCSFSAMAQTPEEIFENYEAKTKIHSFNESYAQSSSVCEMELAMGPYTMPIKVVAKYPKQFRCDMEMQGTNVLIIVNDKVAYVTAQGQTQKIEDEAQIKQLIPMTDFAGEMAPTMDKFTDLKFIGTEGKGKKECYVVEGIEVESQFPTTLYFNKKSALLTAMVIKATTSDGTEIENKVELSNYTEYADGEVYLPSKMTTPTPEGNVVIKVTNFEVDYPTAPWMFAAPKM